MNFLIHLLLQTRTPLWFQCENLQTYWYLNRLQHKNLCSSQKYMPSLTVLTPTLLNWLSLSVFHSFPSSSAWSTLEMIIPIHMQICSKSPRVTTVEVPLFPKRCSWYGCVSNCLFTAQHHQRVVYIFSGWFPISHHFLTRSRSPSPFQTEISHQSRQGPFHCPI